MDAKLRIYEWLKDNYRNKRLKDLRTDNKAQHKKIDFQYYSDGQLIKSYCLPVNHNIINIEFINVHGELKCFYECDELYAYCKTRGIAFIIDFHTMINFLTMELNKNKQCQALSRYTARIDLVSLFRNCPCDMGRINLKQYPLESKI